MSFRNVFNNKYSKTWGGTNKGIADPFITGYFGVYFADMPDAVAINANTINNGVGNEASSSKTAYSSLLTSACLSINVPGVTLNKTTFNGIGTKKWSVPSNTDIGDTISLRFLEFSGLPVSKLFYNWVDAIRSLRYQSSKLTNGTYTKSAYSCSIYYWITNPAMTKNDIEIAFCFTGCFPSKVPTDSFNSDVNTNDKVEIDMDFNIDEMFCSLDSEQDWVKVKCQSLIDTLNWDESKAKLVTGELSGPTDTTTNNGNVNNNNNNSPYVGPPTTYLV